MNGHVPHRPAVIAVVLLLATFVILVTEGIARAQPSLCEEAFETFTKHLSTALSTELSALGILTDHFPPEGKDHDKKVTQLQSDFNKSFEALESIPSSLDTCLPASTVAALDQALGRAQAIDRALSESDFTLFPVAVYQNMVNRAIEHKKDALEAFWDAIF